METGTGREEAIIRAWRLFKALLYQSIEGERMFTGFAFLPGDRPLEHYRRRLPTMLLYHDADQTFLDKGVEAIKQFLLNADGRATFPAVYRGRIIGVLHLPEGTNRQLTTARAWRRSAVFIKRPFTNSVTCFKF